MRSFKEFNFEFIEMFYELKKVNKELREKGAVELADHLDECMEVDMENGTFRYNNKYNIEWHIDFGDMQKVLNESMAASILKEVGGDKFEARRIARKRGYKF